MPRFLASLLASLCLTLLVGAQGRTFQGLVRGADGKPWAGATVVLWHLRPVGTGERMLLQTDERGRYSAELEPLHRYRIFAHTAPEDGWYRVTQPEIMLAGDRTPLREVERKRVLKVKVEGLGAWRGEQLRFSSWGPCAPDADGWLRIPPNAGTFDYLSVFDAAGLQLVTFRGLAPDAEGRCRVQLPPPVRVTLRLRDEQGGAVAGARLLPSLWAPGLLPTALPGSGEHELLVPLVESSEGQRVFGGLRFGLRAPGFAEFDHVRFYDVAPQKDGDRLVMDVELVKGQSWHGRVLLGEGRPYGDARLLQQICSMYADNGRRAGITGGIERQLRADETGAFETPGSDPREPSRLLLRLDERLRTQLPQSKEYPLHPLLLLATLPAAKEPIRTDAGELRIDELHALDLEVRRANGVPARFAHIVLLEWGGPDRPMTMRTDERGRLRILLPSSERVSLGARSQFEIRLESVEISGPKELVLTLKPRPFVEGVVQDADGRALPGVSVSKLGAGLRHGRMLEAMLGGRSATTDARGRFRLLAGEPGEECMLYLRKGVPGRPGFLSGSERVLIEGDSVRDLVFTLAPKK